MTDSLNQQEGRLVEDHTDDEITSDSDMVNNFGSCVSFQFCISIQFNGGKCFFYYLVLSPQNGLNYITWITMCAYVCIKKLKIVNCFNDIIVATFKVAKSN